MGDIIGIYMMVSIMYGLFKGIEFHIDEKIEITEAEIILLPSVPISLILLLIIKLIDKEVEE